MKKEDVRLKNGKKLSETDIEENNEIIQKANQYAILGLKTKDSIHISCAVHAGCDYFLTTDDKILNKSHLIEEIKLCDPINFIKEFEK